MSPVALLLLPALFGSAAGHAMMTVPPGRQFVHGVSIDPKGLDRLRVAQRGHRRRRRGKAVAKARGHGLCGDDGGRALFSSPGSAYGAAAPTATWTEGATVDVEVVVTAHHLGWFEFRLCAEDPAASELTQACLNEHALADLDAAGASFAGVVDGTCCSNGGSCSPEDANEDRFMVPDFGREETYALRYVLPAGVTCDHCTLQFTYVTGNSVDNYPEAFWNCADVAIVADGAPTAAPQAVVAPAPTDSASEPPTGDPRSRCCWWTVDDPLGDQCASCDSALEASCAASRSKCEGGCGGTYCPYDASWTPAPSAAAASAGCRCGAISALVSDAWCEAVACDAAYADFCALRCPDSDPAPAPTASGEDPAPAPTASGEPGCVDSTSWYYKKSKNTCEKYVTKKSKNCKKEGRISFITLDSAPNSDAPREVVWDGDALYDTMTLADVLEVMTETDPTWDNEHDWQRVKIVALQDYAAANSKRFLWAFGGWSDLTKTIEDDQVDAVVEDLVALLALGGADGVDFDWEHLSQYRDSDPDLHAQQRVVVGKVIVALKAALVEAGMEDMWICYTPRYNAFFPTTGSTYGQNNIMTDGEGIDIFDYVVANSAYGVDAVDYVHLMMYDLDATTAFADATESYFVQAHYDAVVQSHVDYGIPLEKIVMGFEPGPQAYTGVWGGLDHDKATIDALHAAGIGGVMFWAMNDPKTADGANGNGETVGANSAALANYAAAL
ncbi:hypothetical protein JL722_6795 [Aureococcus anophagefferens]|nr:hypothetical protein JL722_6795 [Aureococcus anophagefferens]